MRSTTPEWAALREERDRRTTDWLTGNFSLKPIKPPASTAREAKGASGRTAGKRHDDWERRA